MKNEMLKTRIPTLAGILLIIAGIAITTLITQKGIPFISNASPSETPENIRVTNITDSSFTVSYKTTGSVLGSVSFGTTSTTIDNTAIGDTTQKNLHVISVKNLSQKTMYFFRITSGETKFLDNGKPFTVTTGPKLTDILPQNPTLSGTMIFPDATQKEAIVYVTTANAQVLSTDVKPNGTFNLSLSNMRTKDLQSYLPLSGDIPITILIQGNNAESQLTALPRQLSPLPTILLSQTYDFTISENPITTPSAILGFPLFTTNPSEVTTPKILTPKKDEGFTDQQPEFTGTASPSAEVTIEIHSDEQIQTAIKTDKNGMWSYRPKTPLSPGKHTISITTRDQFGILKVITQNFVVYAEGSQVSQSATPSATLTPKITQTPTPIQSGPTTTPTPVPVIIPTTIISPTPPQTSSQMPSPGNSLILYIGISACITTVLGFLLLRSRGRIS